MTALRGTDDAGRAAEPLDPENLRTLLQGAGVFVVVEPADGTAGAAARAERSGSEGWSVEVRDPRVGGTRVARVPNTDAAFDLLRSWAADDGWWEEAFGWRSVSG